MAQQILTQFQEHPDGWTRVPDVLERASFPQTKVRFIVAYQLPHSWAAQYIGLQILEKLILTRWKSLPEGQRQGKQIDAFLRSLMLTRTSGIRNFIVNITVKVASDETSLRREKTYVNKLNLALVQVCVITRCLLWKRVSTYVFLDPQAGMAT